MKIINTIDIQSTPEKVFYWIDDPDRAKEWMTSVTEGEILHETPERVGTTYREVIEENGRKTEMHGVVTGFSKDKMISFHAEGKYNSVDIIFVLEKKGDLTQLTQQADLNFKSFTRFIMLFMWPVIKKKIMTQSQMEFTKLKALCEQE